MGIAHYLKEIGRGSQGARSLDIDQSGSASIRGVVHGGIDVALPAIPDVVASISVD